MERVLVQHEQDQQQEGILDGVPQVFQCIGDVPLHGACRKVESLRDLFIRELLEAA